MPTEDAPPKSEPAPIRQGVIPVPESARQFIDHEAVISYIANTLYHAGYTNPGARFTTARAFYASMMGEPHHETVHANSEARARMEHGARFEAIAQRSYDAAGLGEPVPNDFDEELPLIDETSMEAVD